MIKLQELLQSIRTINEIKDNPIVQSLAMDSRKVQSGTVFICIRGYTVDGHDYAKQAEERGAVAIIAERSLDVKVPVIIVRDTRRAMAQLACHFYDNPTNKLQLIGVTGTNGKTTITHLLEQMLKDRGNKTGLIGTMYTKIGDEQFETRNTTPESLTLQSIFSDMVQSEVESAIMEVSSHALHQGRVRGCAFDIAVFTNLTPDHLDYHDSFEAYLYAKGLLFAQMGNTFENKLAVLNVDDKASEELARMTNADIITYGIKTDADVMALNIQMNATGTSFILKANDERITINMHLIGLFSVYNALAAATVGYSLGIPLPSIKHSLEQVEGIAGRFETVNVGQDFTVIVDYAHTADSLENVLKTVTDFAHQKIFVVVGCGGDRDRTKRPVMANIAVQYADHAFFTSDNPRSEEPEQIIEEMIIQLKEDKYEVIIDRAEAIRRAIFQAERGDVIVIAGKGHETYQILKDQTIHFDDRKVARQAIKERMSS